MSVNEKMTAIADNIRAKTGGTEPLTLDGMAESIPDVYTAGQSSMVDESKLIPKTVSGSYISVDDVSEIPHKVKCKVESVNLCPEEVKSGRYYDAAPSASGADAGYIRILPFAVEPLTTYTFSSNLFAYSIWLCGADGGIERIEWANSYVRTIITPENCTELRISLINKSGAADTTAFEYAMLNKGTTALPHTPYVKPEEVKVTRTGQNLVNIDEMLNSVLKKNDDGTYTITKLSLNDRVSKAYSTSALPAGTYKMSVNAIENSSIDGLVVWIDFEDGSISYIALGLNNNVMTLVLQQRASKVRLYLQGKEEDGAYVTFSNFQISIGPNTIPNEPYNGQTLTPASDGTVEGMTSVSPYMNIFSDTEGVNIEAEYNKSYGMQTEYDRFWDAFQQNGKRTNYTFAFGNGWTAEIFRPKYPIRPLNARYFIYNSTNEYIDIPDFVEFCNEHNIIIDFSNCTNAEYALCSLKTKRLGVLDFSKCSVLNYTFGLDAAKTGLETIDKLITSTTTIYQQSTFSGAITLKNITFEGLIGYSINFQRNPLTKASITSVVNALSDTATGQTLTLNLSAVNTAFETSAGAGDGSTSAEFAALVATKTNWTITMI